MSAEPIPHELLLHHADFLRRLARDLVSDHAAAEDAVQDVWLRALERPPAHDSNLRGWLGVLLKNFVRGTRRTALRREDRERERAIDPLRDGYLPAESDESMLRPVTEAVLALDEPLRSTVLQHYFQGLSTTEIARRQNVAASTVKSRLQRALEILRVRMKRDGGDSWRASMLLLTTSADGSRVAAAGKGVILMTLKTKVMIGCAAGLIALLAYRAAMPAELEPARPLESVSIPLVSGSSLHAESNASVREPQGPATAPPAVAPSASPASVNATALRARFVDRLGVPIEHVQAFVDSELLAESDAHGVITLEFTDRHNAHMIFLAARHPRYSDVSINPTLIAHTTVDVGDVVMSAGGTIRGRIVDSHGAPVEGAFVESFADVPYANDLHSAADRPGSSTLAYALTAADGTYVLANSPPVRQRVCAKKDEFQYCWTQPFDLKAGDDSVAHDITLLAIDVLDILEVVVLTPDGVPLPRARIAYRTNCSDGANSRGTTSADEHGLWRVIVRNRCPYDIVASDPKGTFGVALVDALMPGTPRVELRLSATTSVALRVVDDAGVPVESFSARVTDPDRIEDTSDPITRRPRDRSATLFEVKGLEHPLGTCELRAPFVRCRIEVAAAGYEPALAGPFEADAIPSAVTVVVKRLPGARGIVVAQGRPVANAKVSLMRAIPSNELTTWQGFPIHSHPKPIASGTSNGGGAFDIGFDFEGAIYVRAEADGFAAAEIGPLTVARGTVLDGLRAELGLGGILEGHVLGMDGSVSAGMPVSASRADGFAQSTTTDARGEFRFERLTPGRWLVRAIALAAGSSTHGGTPAAEMPWSCTVIDGSVTRFDVDLRERSTVRGKIVTGEAACEGWSASLQLAGDGEPTPTQAIDSNGDFLAVGREPGAYTLRIMMGTEFANGWIETPLTLAAGENTWSTHILFGQLTLSATERKPIQLHGQLGDGSTAIVNVGLDGDAPLHLTRFPAGIWRAMTWDAMSNGWVEVARTRVEAGQEASLVIR